MVDMKFALHSLGFKIIGIMASDLNGVVGGGGKLLWHLPRDIEYFHHIIQGQVLIVGRKTYQNLPDRIRLNHRCIIFSKSFPGDFFSQYPATIVNSLSDFFSMLTTCSMVYNAVHKKQLFLIGGAEIANLFLGKNLISEFILTKVAMHCEGDSFLHLDKFCEWQDFLLRDLGEFSIHLLKFC